MTGETEGPPLVPLLAWLDKLSLRKQADIEERARLLLLDTLACVASGLSKKEPAALADRLAAVSPGSCSWPGHAARLVPAEAAYLGTLAACWDEACEGLARAHGRPGLHAVPVAVALGSSLGHSLGDVLTAIVKAYEIGGRFGASMRIREGMHVDGTWGLMASTAAACLSLAAGRNELISALAAACQMPCSLYLPVSKGCSVRNTYAAHAAATGIHLAQATLAGIRSPESAFVECDRMTLAGHAGSWEAFDDHSNYYLLDGYLKPFAAVRHVHYPAACAIEWWQRRGQLTSENIEAVSVETYAEALTYCGNRAPATPIQAQFSLSYGTAFALRTGKLGPQAYAPEVLTDPAQQSLEKLIQFSSDPAMDGQGASLTVRFGDDSRRHSVSAVCGDPEFPMDREAVANKARDYLLPAIGKTRALWLIDCILNAALSTPLRVHHG